MEFLGIIIWHITVKMMVFLGIIILHIAVENVSFSVTHPGRQIFLVADLFWKDNKNDKVLLVQGRAMVTFVCDIFTWLLNHAIELWKISNFINLLKSQCNWYHP
jgi:hypothetical protein